MLTATLPGNRLLARLPRPDYDSLLPRLEPVPLVAQQILFQARSPVEYVYFPTRGRTSTVCQMNDGSAIEVAAVGPEGVVGLCAIFGDGLALHRIIVQAEGAAVRVRAGELQEVMTRGGALDRLLRTYQTAYLAQVTQGAACHGLHTVQQRCCRWLLAAHDSAQADELRLTHEFLALMLGVRRPSVTDVLAPLQERGLLRNGRGWITVLDRAGLEATACECYRAATNEYERLFA